MSTNWSATIIAVIIAVLGILAAFTWQYLGNQAVREKIHAALSWLRLKVLQEHFFWCIYVPAFALVIALLHWTGTLTQRSGLLAFALWLSPWSIWLARKKRKVASVASCDFRDDNAALGQDGLIYVRYDDGDAKKEIHQGAQSLRTDAASGNYYIYFRIRDNAVGRFRDHHCIVLVEFFDQPSGGSFDLQYDSNEKKHANPRYKGCSPFFYTASGQWRLAYFDLPDPSFRQKQNGSTDFRLRVDPLVNQTKVCLDLRIRRVICLCLPD